MIWYKDYDFIFLQFEKKNENMNETVFYFQSEPEGTEDHYIGYLSQYEKPYWAGYCDIPGGCDFKTAKELFEAKIYDGRSIKDRWDELVLLEINGVSIDEVPEHWGLGQQSWLMEQQ